MSNRWERLRALAAPWAQAKAKAIAKMWPLAVGLLCMGWAGSASATDILAPYWHYMSEPFADAESPQGSCDLMAARFGGPLVFHAGPTVFGEGKWVVGECWTVDPVSPRAFSAVFHVASCPPDYALVDYPAAPDAASCQLGGEVVDIPGALSPPPPECDVCKGNPIYPLRAVKREEVDTGLVIGRTTLTFTYDTTSKTPKTPKVYATVPGLEQAGSVLGSPLWYSNLHRRGTVRTYSSGIGLPVVAVFPRGYAQVITMPRAADGTFAPEPGDADRIMSIVGGGYRYNDSKHSAQETYDTAGVLTSMAWTDGTLASFTYSDGTTPASIAPVPGLLIGATDNRGHSLSFRYVAAGALTRLVSITDAAGQSTTLGYDGQNRLVGITWPDGTTRSFLYENSGLPWALTGVSDERAKRYSTFTYDTEGRAIATEHAGGVDRYSVSYTTPPGIQVDQVAYPGGIARFFSWVQPQGLVMTEPSGQTTTWSTVSVNGKNQFSSQSQPAGAGSLASSRSQSYDVNGRVASQDDFNGKRSCYVHDAARGLEAVQVTRVGSELSCTSVTGPGANLPAGAVKVSTQWHPDWNLPIRVAEPGKLTTRVHNGRPDPLNGGTVAICAPAGAVMPDGKPIAALCKRVEQSTADSNGSTGFALGAGVPSGPSVDSTVSLLLHADGGQASTVMTDSSPSAKTVTAAGGAQLSMAASRFGPTSIRFNGGNSHVAAQGADAFNFGSGDFTVEFWVYLDSASTNYRGLVVHDQIGGVRGWLIYTETTGVPQAGALSAAIWSGSTAYSVQDTVPLPLDTWHHVALVRLGQTLALYRNGQPAGASVNVGSAAISDVQEPAVIGALQVVGAVAANSTFSGYIDEVRITKGLARYAAAFTVPTAPFVAVSDPLPPPEPPTTGTPPLLQTQVPSRVSEWTYDTSGRVLTATDPDTGTTTFAYHAETNADHRSSDLKSITTSLGKVTTFDRYNRYGQVLQSTDPQGIVTVNTYDLRQRLLTNTVGGETTTYAYDAAGQLKKVIFDNGTWVGFDYDDAHRRVAAYDNKANRIDYVLDNAGNQTDQHVKDPAGALKRGLARVMDVLGRAQQSNGKE